MAQVNIQIECDPALQPLWAKHFLDYYQFNRQLAASKDNITAILMSVQICLQTGAPFVPPVTLFYMHPKHYWAFQWNTEEEHTMFLLKWS